MKIPHAISVVIPSYRSRHLLRVLESLQALQAAEIIVVDSSPEPPDLGEYKVTLVRPEGRLTAGAARNAGAKKARGEWLFFLDSDVVLQPESVAAINTLIQDEASDLWSGVYDCTQSQDTFFSRLQDRILMYREHYCAERNSPLCSSAILLVRKDKLVEVGMFNEVMESYEDMEFMARFKKFSRQPQMSRSLTGVHLKRYTFANGLKDYFVKAFNSVHYRRRYRRTFDGYSSHFGRGLALSLLAAAAAIPTAAAAIALGAFGLGVASLVAALVAMGLWLAALPFVLQLTRGESFAMRLKSWFTWPFLGATIIGAVKLGHLTWYLGRAKYWTVFFIDLCRNGWRVVWRNGMPVQIIAYVTSRCNLRCNHCFYKETLDNPNPGEIKLSVFDKLSKSIGSVLWFSLGGGEPFIRKDLPQLIDTIQRNCRPKVFSFPTNGWYTEATFEMCLRVLEKMDGGNLILFFSIDGRKEMHNAIRGPKSYEKVQETVARLQPLKKLFPNLYMNVVTTVTEQNCDTAAEFIDELLNDLNPSAISINLFRYHSLEHPPLPEKLLTGYKAAVDLYSKRLREGAVKHYGFLGGRVLLFKEILQKELIYRVAKSDEFVTPCTAGTLSYVIMEDGSFKPCEILSDKIGDVTEGDSDLRKLVRSPRAKELRKWIKESECRCTYECAMSTNTLFSWPMSRRLASSIVKDALSIG